MRAKTMHPARNKRPPGAQRADQLQKAVRRRQAALRPAPSADHFHFRFHCPGPYPLSLLTSSADGEAVMRLGRAGGPNGTTPAYWPCHNGATPNA